MTSIRLPVPYASFDPMLNLICSTVNTCFCSKSGELKVAQPFHFKTKVSTRTLDQLRNGFGRMPMHLHRYVSFNIPKIPTSLAFWTQWHPSGSVFPGVVHFLVQT